MLSVLPWGYAHRTCICTVHETSLKRNAAGEETNLVGAKKKTIMLMRQIEAGGMWVLVDPVRYLARRTKLNKRGRKRNATKQLAAFQLSRSFHPTLQLPKQIARRSHF